MIYLSQGFSDPKARTHVRKRILKNYYSYGELLHNLIVQRDKLDWKIRVRNRELVTVMKSLK